MSLLPYNMPVLDTTGRALSGALVYFCSQPANVSNNPTPLATIYTNTTGTVSPNPVTSDGYGQVVAYLDSTQLYTVVVTHPLLGVVAYYDQWVGGPSTSTFTYALQAWSAIAGQTNYTLQSTPNPLSALLVFQNGLGLLNGLGYTMSGNVVQLATATQAGDSIFALIPSTT